MAEAMINGGPTVPSAGSWTPAEPEDKMGSENGAQADDENTVPEGEHNGAQAEDENTVPEVEHVSQSVPVSKRTHENSGDEEEEEEPLTKRGKSSDEGESPTGTQSTSNGATPAVSPLSTPSTPGSTGRRRGRPKKERITPKPDENTPKRKPGRPRIHPKKDPSAEKRPRGRPPSSAKSLAALELAKQMNSGKVQSPDVIKKFAEDHFKKVDTMKKKIKELESLLEERDEEIFLLRTRLQEMGVDTDSLSMNASLASNRRQFVYLNNDGSIQDSAYSPEDEGSEEMSGIVVIQPECP